MRAKIKDVVRNSWYNLTYEFSNLFYNWRAGANVDKENTGGSQKDI